MPSTTEIPSRFLSILDFDHETLGACLERAAQYKAARTAGVYDQKVLKHRHVALLFEKPSLRTRSTFQIAVRELGGDVIEPGTDVALGGRESFEPTVRTS
jgi:ornithine carbamoyltransferase